MNEFICDCGDMKEINIFCRDQMSMNTIPVVTLTWHGKSAVLPQ